MRAVDVREGQKLSEIEVGLVNENWSQPGYEPTGVLLANDAFVPF